MTYAIIIENRVAQISDTSIEVAEPIFCIEIPANTDVKENYTYSKDANGVVTYTAPPAPKQPEEPSLKDQANSALQSAREYVTNNYSMLNEQTPDAWVTYLKALMEISNGTDTTSTTLPSKPTT